MVVAAVVTVEIGDTGELATLVTVATPVTVVVNVAVNSVALENTIAKQLNIIETI